MSRLRWATLAAGLMVTLVAKPASAIYIVTVIDSDGLGFTDVRGINNSGQVVGYNASGAFLYAGGTFRSLANPTGYVNGALALNDRGVIVGGAYDADRGAEKGSILNHDVYSLYSHPGYAFTEFRGVNNAGLVSGIAYNSANAPQPTIGFVFNPTSGVYTDFALPTGNYSIVNQINAAGQVVGSTSTLDFSSTQSFVRGADGTIVYGIGGNGARVRGINDAGTVAGSTRSGSASFVISANGTESFAAPGAHGTFAESINNAGQVSGFFYTDADSSAALGFIASPAVLPTRTAADNTFVFDVAVTEDVPVFIDPLVATGYDYAIGAGDPNFSTVTLPIGVGDSVYTVMVGGHSFTVTGGEAFDFVDNGFAGGVAAFEVTGIEPSAMIDPSNPAGFVTELTFVASGRFTGTQRALATSVVPEPDVAALGLLALAIGAVVRRRPGRPRSCTVEAA